ncbi:hypothetical protein [Endozoicomonas sp.]|uniref:hypothetical protein n=1 Tax=Endozoicomonas sp. TaxID=1892382 RepID=UPI003AF49A95
MLSSELIPQFGFLSGASYNKAHIPGAKQFLFPIPDMKEWNAAETENRSLEDYQALLGNDK